MFQDESSQCIAWFRSKSKITMVIISIALVLLIDASLPHTSHASLLGRTIRGVRVQRDADPSGNGWNVLPESETISYTEACKLLVEWCETTKKVTLHSGLFNRQVEFIMTYSRRIYIQITCNSNSIHHGNLVWHCDASTLTISATFHSLFRVVFIFRSCYLFAIGLDT